MSVAHVRLEGADVWCEKPALGSNGQLAHRDTDVDSVDDATCPACLQLIAKFGISALERLAVLKAKQS